MSTLSGTVCVVPPRPPGWPFMSMSLDHWGGKNQHTVMETMHAIDLLNEGPLLAKRRFPTSGTSPTDVKSSAHASRAQPRCPVGNWVKNTALQNPLSRSYNQLCKEGLLSVVLCVSSALFLDAAAVVWPLNRPRVIYCMPHCIRR